MSAQFPAYQYMISSSEPEQILQDHEHNLEIRNATNKDCFIIDLETIQNYSLAYKQGFRCRYKLHWTTYKGWQVYMLHTGCFAVDPKFERPSVAED